MLFFGGQPAQLGDIATGFETARRLPVDAAVKPIEFRPQRGGLRGLPGIFRRAVQGFEQRARTRALVPGECFGKIPGGQFDFDQLVIGQKFIREKRGPEILGRKRRARGFDKLDSRAEKFFEAACFAKADEAEMQRALVSARIGDLVAHLPDGLDTVVGERGYRLSGGERQRLAIARLLLKAPPIVVLDEATAHLDSESELAVQRALDAAMEGRTSIVIAHRLSTIRDADLILVVDDGRIVERGRHAELLAAGGLYSELYRTQFSAASPPRRSA